MKIALYEELTKAFIDYNNVQDEDNQLDWFDMLDCIEDKEDYKEVAKLIRALQKGATMNALIFVRGARIQDQIAECMNYAERKGYDVKYVTVGQGNELASILYQLDTEIDVVIVRDFERISRNALENYAIQAELELDFGITVEDVTGKSKTPESEMLFISNVIRAVSETDAMRMRERIYSKMS